MTTVPAPPTRPACEGGSLWEKVVNGHHYTIARNHSHNLSVECGTCDAEAVGRLIFDPQLGTWSLLPNSKGGTLAQAWGQLTKSHEAMVGRRNAVDDQFLRDVNMMFQAVQRVGQ